MILTEVGYGKKKVNELVRQKDKKEEMYRKIKREAPEMLRQAMCLCH